MNTFVFFSLNMVYKNVYVNIVLLVYDDDDDVDDVFTALTQTEITKVMTEWILRSRRTQYKREHVYTSIMIW